MQFSHCDERMNKKIKIWMFRLFYSHVKIWANFLPNNWCICAIPFQHFFLLFLSFSSFYSLFLCILSFMFVLLFSFNLLCLLVNVSLCKFLSPFLDFFIFFLFFLSFSSTQLSFLFFSFSFLSFFKLFYLSFFLSFFLSVKTFYQTHTKLIFFWT